MNASESRNESANAAFDDWCETLAREGTGYPPDRFERIAFINGFNAACAVSESAPMFDAVQLSEARFYRESKEPIGILARAILRANGEMK